MATPAEHRRDVAELTDIAERDLRLVLNETKSAEEARDGLMDVLPKLVVIYGSAAATLSADWYDDMRDESGAKGRFRAIPAEPPDRVRAETLARWAVSPLFSAEPDLDATVGRVIGGTQRVIADTGRETVIGSLREDSQGGGWSRATSGGCEFCEMLAGRGAVYSAETADFSSHDNCRCVAVPEFGAVRDAQPYVPTQRRRNARKSEVDTSRDVDAERTTAQLRETLASLEKSLTKFESPGTRARVEELRRKIAARAD